MRIRMVGLSDIGKKRKKNQDSLLFDESKGLVVVADGVGGRKGGEIASSIVASTLKAAIQSTKNIQKSDIPAFLTQQIEKVNQQIIDKGQEDDTISGMGSTVNCLLFKHSRLYIANVGDSRTYLYQDKHFWPLTIDHNVSTFVERGWISSDSLAPGTKSGALVRALGLAEKCEVDVFEIQPKPGQIFLTCSDGLYGMVNDRKISHTITENLGNFKKLPEILVDLANANGGEDNVTVVLAKVDSLK